MGRRCSIDWRPPVVLVYRIGDEEGMRNLRDAKGGSSCDFSGVLPVFVDELEAVAVGIENVGGVVARIVVEPDAGRAIVDGSGRDCGGVGGVDLFPARSYKAEVRGAAIRHAFLEPQVEAPVGAEAFEVRMAGRSIPAVVIEAIADAERSQSRLVKRDRALYITHCEKDVIQHGGPFVGQMAKGRTRIL